MIKIYCRIIKIGVVLAIHIFDRCHITYLYLECIYVEYGKIRLLHHCVFWFIAVFITDRST